MGNNDRLAKKYRSSTHYVLAGLIPYTEANLKLSFKPSAFLRDLEKLDHITMNKKALEGAYYRAIRRGLIKLDPRGIPRLTDKGIQKVRPYRPQKLKDSKLLVLFDIPEAERFKRTHLRLLLKELAFTQVQKSVWMSDKDHRQYLKSEIREHSLQDYVAIFEARLIK